MVSMTLQLTATDAQQCHSCAVLSLAPAGGELLCAEKLWTADKIPVCCLPASSTALHLVNRKTIHTASKDPLLQTALALTIIPA
jgi:hypothetical protein